MSPKFWVFFADLGQYGLAEIWGFFSRICALTYWLKPDGSLFCFGPHAGSAFLKMPRAQDNLWTHVTKITKYGGSGAGKWKCNFVGKNNQEVQQD